jgi:hypothetical protein
MDRTRPLFIIMGLTLTVLARQNVTYERPYPQLPPQLTAA